MKNAPLPVVFLSIFLSSASVAEHWQRQLADRSAEILEGDILMAPAANQKQRPSSAAVQNTWTGGVIPYVMDTDLPDPAGVRRAMDEWSNATPVRFVVRTNQVNYLRIRRGATPFTCNSYVGMIGSGPQDVNLGTECPADAFTHELGHALGLWHMQNRSDRDQYVTIDYVPMNKSCIHNFDPAPAGTRIVGPYDWGSIMQYFKYSFSRDGRPTMTTIPPGIPIGEAKHISAGDIDAVNRIYGKTPATTTITSVPPGLRMLVDGEEITTPRSFAWAAATEHTIEPVAIQSIDDTRYRFVRWPDADADIGVTAGSRTIRVSSNVTVFIAGFAREFPVSVAQLPDTLGRLTLDRDSEDGYYPDGAVLTIKADLQPGVNFVSWEGIDRPNRGTYLEDQAYPTGSMNPRTFVVFQARSISSTVTTRPVIRVDSTPANFFIPINGNPIRTPAVLIGLRPGDPLVLEAPATLDCRAFCNIGTRFRFGNWDIGVNDQDAGADPRALKRTLTVPSGSASFNVNYSTEHQIRIQGDVLVQPPSADSYFTEGTIVTATGTAPSNSYFGYWQGDLTDLDLPTSVAPATGACGNPLRIRALEPLTLFAVTPAISPATPAPVFAAAGLVNNASKVTGGPVAPGQLIEITGRNLGAAAEQKSIVTTAGILDTCAGTTRVTFDGVVAPVVTASATRVVVAVPFRTTAATTRVVVEYLGVRSSPVTLPVASTAPGIFTVSSDGTGPAVAYLEDGTANSPDTPAASGSVVTFYATGLGATNPVSADGLIATDRSSLADPITVMIGGQPAEVRYAGTQQGLIVSQTRIDVVVPDGLGSGANEVVVTAGGRDSRAGVTISVQ